MRHDSQASRSLGLLALILILTACGQEPTQTSAPAPEPTEAATSVAAPEPIAAPAPAEPAITSAEMPAEERVGEPTGEVAPEPATSRRTIPGYVSSRPREVEREKDASERLLDLDRIAHDAYRLAQYGSEPHLQRTVPLLCDSIHALEGSREDEPEAFTEGVEQLTEIQEMLEQGVNNMEVMDEGQKQSYRDLVMSVHDVVTEMLVAMELQDFLIHVNFEQVSELGIPFDETGVQEMSEGEWENYLRQQEAAAQQN